MLLRRLNRKQELASFVGTLKIWQSFRLALIPDTSEGEQDAKWKGYYLCTSFIIRLWLFLWTLMPH